MVVYRKEINGSDTLTGITAAQSAEESSNEAGKSASPVSQMVPRAILTSRPNSHPFQERNLSLDQAIKVGRSVARCRPATSNAIFDCKVLSRNHALLWYENGKFYLQDTKSSNGTFVNNQRLSKGSEESPAREVCSGDIVQFGVDVVENSRKVVHGCIVATLKLYLPDGKEAKASPTTAVVPLSPETSISSQEIYQLSQYLQEAIHREQILESKLGMLQKVISNTYDESDIGWKALIEEDRLLSRIETLESQLQTCGKNATEEKLKEDVLKLQEDKDKYQAAAKESLKKVLQEKLEAIRKVQDLENSLSNTEYECVHLSETNKQKEEEIQVLLEKSTESEKEIANLTKKLQELEEKYQDLISQTNEDKLTQESTEEERRKEEQILSTKIEALQAENDFAKEQLSAMKAHYDILKKDQDNEENIEKNGNYSPPGEVNRLELELQRVQKENLKNETLLHSDSEDCTSNGEVKPEDYVNKLQNDIQQLKKLLCETRDNKKVVEGELIEVRGQLDEVQNNELKMAAELNYVQEQLSIARKNAQRKADQVIQLENKLQSIRKEGDDDDDRDSPEEKDNLNESPFISMNFKELNETLSSMENSSLESSTPEYEKLIKDCAMYKEKICDLECDLLKYIVSNSRLEAQSQTLVESCSKLETAKQALEERDGDYWKEHRVMSQSELDVAERKLVDAHEEIILVKERFEECNREKSYLQGELHALKEQLQLLSVQSKTVGACSVIPLIVLAIAMLLAFYPTLAHLTATSDQM